MLKAKANLKAIREARQTDGKEEAVVEKHNDPEINANIRSNDLTLATRANCNAQCFSEEDI